MRREACWRQYAPQNMGNRSHAAQRYAYCTSTSRMRGFTSRPRILQLEMSMRASPHAWEPLHLCDANAVYSLAGSVHTELPERIEVFADRILLFQEGCRKIVRSGRLAGYGIAHPGVLDSPPPLDSILGAIPECPDCLHLHDAVVMPELRGHGAGPAYLEEMAAVAQAHGITMLTLVSVYGTNRLWTRCGFTIRNTPALAVKLAAYGPTACYMVRSL